MATVEVRILKMPDVPATDRILAKRLWNWMIRNSDQYDNATSLAEAAAHGADGDRDAWLDDSDHWIWDLAAEIIPAE